MGGQQKNFISDIVFFQHHDGMRKKVRRHFLQCREDSAGGNVQLHRIEALELAGLLGKLNSMQRSHSALLGVL